MDQKFRRNVSGRDLGTGTVNGAGALIYCAATRRYLFVLRNGHAHDGSWGIVGGKIEPGETVVQGLYREIQEEIGLDLSDRKIVPVEKFTSDRKHFVYHTYLIRVDSEFVPNLNHEHRGYCWVQLRDYPRPMHPGVWRTFNFQTVIDKLETLQTVL